MLCEATQWPKTHYFNEYPVTRWFSHLKSATVDHTTFVNKNVQLYNAKLCQVGLKLIIPLSLRNICIECLNWRYTVEI